MKVSAPRPRYDIGDQVFAAWLGRRGRGVSPCEIVQDAGAAVVQVRGLSGERLGRVWWIRRNRIHHRLADLYAMLRGVPCSP